LRSGPTVLTSSCHELATAGTRMFGDFFGGKSPIKVRIYDFALYFDAKQVRALESVVVREQQYVLWMQHGHSKERSFDRVRHHTLSAVVPTKLGVGLA